MGVMAMGLSSSSSVPLTLEHAIVVQRVLTNRGHGVMTTTWGGSRELGGARRAGGGPAVAVRAALPRRQGRHSIPQVPSLPPPSYLPPQSSFGITPGEGPYITSRVISARESVVMPNV